MAQGLNRAYGDRSGGFTIIELMVVLTVMAVVAGIGIPAFQVFITQNALTADVNDFVAAVNEARSEAIRRRAPVSVRSDNAGDNANEWGAGYCVTVGAPATCDDALRRYEPTTPNSFNGTGALNTVAVLTFNGRGVLTNVAALPATVELCAPGIANGRQVRVSPIGRVQVQEITTCPV